MSEAAAIQAGVRDHGKAALRSGYDAAKGAVGHATGKAAELNSGMAKAFEGGVWHGIKGYARKNPLYTGAMVGGAVIGSAVVATKVLGRRERQLGEARAAQQGLQR